jgi:hypothetical protein
MIKPMTDERMPVVSKTDKGWAEYLRRRAADEKDREASMAYSIGADAIEGVGPWSEAEEEIRRLWEENEELRKFRDADIGQINVLGAENAKLRKVMDAAREALPWLEPIGDGRRYTAAIYHALKQALRELDERKK